MTSPEFRPPSLSAWAADVEASEDPTFIIPTFLPADSLVLLSGAPKDAKKTWFGMLTALVAATGKGVGPLTCENPVPVLYIYREGARKPTLQRFKALAAGNGFPPVSEIHNLYFHHRGNFWLDGPQWVGAVAEFVQEHGIKLIYIDTFAKSCSAEENSSKEIGLAIQQCEKLRNIAGTVVLVHHVRKAQFALSAGKSGTPKPDDDVRGSSAFSGAYELHWAIRQYSTGEQQQSYLLVNGKECDYSAYCYAWDFQSEKQTDGTELLVSAACHLGASTELPQIEAPKGTRKRGEDE